MFLSVFPKEISFKIFDSLNADNLSKFSCCCLEIKEMISKLELWKRFLIKDFPDINYPEIRDANGLYRLLWKQKIKSQIKVIEMIKNPFQRAILHIHVLNEELEVHKIPLAYHLFIFVLSNKELMNNAEYKQTLILKYAEMSEKLSLFGYKLPSHLLNVLQN